MSRYDGLLSRKKYPVESARAIRAALTGEDGDCSVLEEVGFMLIANAFDNLQRLVNFKISGQG